MTTEKRLYDEASERLCDHALSCRDGCKMHYWTCDEGQELIVTENLAWYAYRRTWGMPVDLGPGND